ncbi:flagellar biosynthesis anti-sigma factor FlgM [Chromobacterium sp. IIBBL 290-4]|uniref:flagellar biosynthesis anti-sigma factor FlgM n=1 Tax=Chromobacterium sp. IIBBL 290-4 TaxID=2953890 RepID=UPI0020B69210|nr:flagellar biosynthesis anti-sigma factor FlgM [Chromobacterium sp. IIBBL 290-4]UTH73159.1 flagellar biosynthesis anti-sigma factor FlgM [Chromobacterium sp. IIBBL 290-4]
MQVTQISSWRTDQAAAAKLERGAGKAPATVREAAAAASLAAPIQSLPEIDLDKVESVRAALARGEVRFDAERLAGLIEQYHGGR